MGSPGLFHRLVRQRTSGLLLVAGLAFATFACGEEEASPTVAAPAMTELYVSNFSPEQVLAVHLRGADDPVWSENLLSRPVRAGNWFGYVARVESGIYDVRMVGESREVELTGFSIVSSHLALSYNPTLSAAPPR